MGRTKCCVPGCTYAGSERYRFPNPKKELTMLRQWKSIIGGNLLEIDDDLIYHRKRICPNHFSPEYSNPGRKKLLRTAIPSLHLPLARPSNQVSSQVPSFEVENELSGLSVIPSPLSHPRVQRADSVICQTTSLASSTPKNQAHRVPTVEVENKQAGRLPLKDLMTSASSPPQVQRDDSVMCQTTSLAISSTSKNEAHQVPPVEVENRQAGRLPLKDLMPSASSPPRVQRDDSIRCQTPSTPNNKGAERDSQGLLKNVGVSRKIQLTPKAAFLYGEAATLKRTVSRMTRKCKDFKSRLADAEKLGNSKAFSTVCKDMTVAGKLFSSIQMRQTAKNPRGRRFSLEEKILSLTIYKQSPKAYRLLQRLFTLPSRRTLSDLLIKVPLQSGLNPLIFDNLKHVVSKMPSSEKYCSLLFDEMSIMPNLQYNAREDFIVGFEDYGEECARPNLADHVLVLMLRGIKRKFKQPIAFYFCQHGTKTTDLVRILKESIKEVQQTGLEVVCTICDQGRSNEAAINALMEDTKRKYLRRGKEWRNGFFEIGNKPITPLFDPPHLLKGIRNNLLVRDAKFTINGKVLTARWKDVVDVYLADPGAANVRVLPKLTEAHVLAEKMPKMKVKVAAQVFSQRVSAIMRLFANTGYNGVEKSAVETADFLLFFDELFDSVNANCSKNLQGKVYRTAVHATSPHHQLWNKALQVIRSIHFLDRKGHTSVPPSVKNWIRTIQGFQNISARLSKIGLKTLLLRNFNQDPLENFFGSVRSHGIRNVNPTSLGFMAAFKTLLINNISSAKSVGSNCKEDDSEGCLDNLRNLFLNIDSSESCIDSSLNIENDQADVTEQGTSHGRHDDVFIPEQNFDRQCGAYVAGYILKKINFQNCKTCINNMYATDINMYYHGVIKAREYDNKKRLKYPKPNVCNLFKAIKWHVAKHLPKNAHKKKILKLLQTQINTKYALELQQFNNCEEHKNVVDLFVSRTLKLLIHSWCRNINLILINKRMVTDKDDIVQMQARERYVKYSKFKK